MGLELYSTKDLLPFDSVTPILLAPTEFTLSFNGLLATADYFTTALMIEQQACLKIRSIQGW
jgi:hypothetical protein